MVDKEKLKIKDIFISGFALFAIFFGAGNLIFPPAMGLKAGLNWKAAALGFNLSDSILIFIGILAMSRRQADLKEFGSKVFPKFGLLIGAIVVTCVGPLLSIPRTGATTYEVGIKTFFPDFNNVLFSIIFFSLVYIFTIRKSKVIDIVGKYMTPLLLIVLALIIISGISKTFPPPSKGAEDQLALGFIKGYNTMDSLGPVFMSGMILSDFKEKGISSEKGLAKATVEAGLIAGTGLILVYTGLTYLGAYSHSYADPNLSQADLLTLIAEKSLGSFGKIALSLAVTVACLTTAVGLLSAFANSFVYLSRGKLKYEILVTLGTIISTCLSVLGVDGIMTISNPILLILYPVVIVLYLLNLFDSGDLDHRIYKSTVVFTFSGSSADGIRSLGFENLSLLKIFEKLPASDLGFGWLTFSLLGLLMGFILVLLDSYKNKDL